MENNKGDVSEEYIPLRMLNEFVYCPRLFYLEFGNGYFVDSADTVEGRVRHRRVDKAKGELPTPEDAERENEDIHATSITLSSKKAGVIAKIDLITGTGKEVMPVEYKKGKAKDGEEKIWESDKLQITMQALILRENGYNCEEGMVYYFSNNKKITVRIDDKEIAWALQVVDNAKDVAFKTTVPSPLIDSPKCIKCSLVSICLPDETTFLKKINKEGNDLEMRRLFPARVDRYPLYVSEQGSFISKSGEELVVKKENKVIGMGKLIEISSISLFGNLQISTQATKELCTRNIPICYFSTGGWFTGITTGISSKNIQLRIEQFKTALNPERALEIAKKFVIGKIKNSRTILRRNARDVTQETLKNLSEIIHKASNAKSVDELMGFEGMAARIYFGNFSKLLKIDEGQLDFDFQERNRRPPRDEVNALLSYLYALLAKDLTITSLIVGLDPYLGFLHKPKYGKPALSLDLMEEFRPIICDSVAISVLNTKEIGKDDFIKRGGAVSLDPVGRKKLINAYERRLDDLIAHPIFKYSISYRQVLEIQARLLGRYVMGEIENYPEFVTR